MRKPNSCIGCTWYQTGEDYVPDEIPKGDVFILMQNPGKTEVEFGKPAQGQAGKDMDYNFLPLAGLERNVNVTVGNVLKCRWNNSNDLPWDVGQRQAVAACTTANLRVPPTTKLIIAQGKLAFEYATGFKMRDANGKFASVSSWRGFLLPLEYTKEQFGGIPVYVCLHTADLYHNPGMEVVTEWDWGKVKLILDGTYPKPLPPRLIVTKDNLHEVRRWFMEARQSRWVTVDTEYIPSTKHLTVLGLVKREMAGRLYGLQLDCGTTDPQTRNEVYFHYKELIRHVPMVFHNCRADIPVLSQAIGSGVSWEDYKAIEDTMLAHAVLWCELPHGLEFVSSVHGQYQKLKHLKANDELLYNFGDCLETDSIWQYITEEGFKHDPQAEHIYRTQHLPLCPILDRSITRGLRVNEDRVRRAKIEYEALVEQARRLACAGAGWGINIGSPKQVAEYLYAIQGYTVQVNKKSGNPSINDEAVARLRMELGPSFDPEEDLTYDSAIQRISEGADPVLEARVLFATASTCLTKYIYAMYECVAHIKEYNYASKGAFDKARDKAIAAVKEGDSTAIIERIHPDMLTHSQKTGRWSTVDPPIAQLPEGLRDIIVPDQGEVWVSYDWSAIEPRILEGYCNSKILKAAFDEGIDLHTWTVCRIFGYDMPPNLCNVMGADNAEWRAKYKWKHSNDPRRVFAKTARYEMYYGGTGANAAAAAALYGLDPKILKRACASLISADPEYYTWRLSIEETIKTKRMLRTFMGRPRRFLKGGHKMVREGLDYNMQGGCADIYNTTVIQLSSEKLQYAWGMHDAHKWHLKREHCTVQFMEWLRGIAARPHIINGRSINFPIDLHIVYPPGEEPIPGLEAYL